MDLGLSNARGGKSAFVFFNVQAPVGPCCPNTLDDVLLVQYLFRKLGQANIPANNSAFATQMSSIDPTGTFDQATADCILGFQKHFGGIADGCIRVAKGAWYRKGTFTIWKLNFWVRNMFSNIWPRIHDFTDCPPLLKSLVPMLL